MRPVKELADVVIKLEVLEDIVVQLQGIIADIQSVIKKCSTWVDETDNSTYEDIKEMLATKTCYYIQTFFQMALERNSKLSESAITEEQMKNISEIQTMEDAGLDIKENFGYKRFEEKLKDMSTSVESCKDMIEILQGKNKVLEKKVKKISEQNQANGNICAEHYKEIMEELSVASSFMSNLKDENIKLRTELSEHNKKMESVFEKVNKSIKIASEFDELKKQNQKLTGDCAELQVNLEMKEAENRKLMDDIGLIPKKFLEKVKMSLKDVYASGVDLFLVGPTGHGKSAVGNSILQKKCFQSGFSRKNFDVEINTGMYKDLRLGVYDLPGFFFEKNEQTDDFPLRYFRLWKMVKRSEYVCVILVLKFGYDLTQEDINYIDSIKSKINQNIFKNCGILIMSRGDIFKRNSVQAMSFQDWLHRQEGCLKDILTEFNGRALLFENISNDADVQTKQLDNLRSMIDEMILNKTFVSKP